MSNAPELLLIDKPAGITSMDVIRQLRKKLQIRKIGHAGTLDPLATGLMLVGVGPGTKKLTELIKLNKEYVAEVRIGESRSTGDLEGEVIEEKIVESLTESEVVTALETMLGTITLPVSAYSAIKVDGVPMYKRARKAEKTGDIIDVVPVRDMEVEEVELLQFVLNEGQAVAEVRFSVGSGTYIRSLGEELGKRLGYPAVLQSLRRTRVGDYTLDEAQSLDAIEKSTTD